MTLQQFISIFKILWAGIKHLHKLWLPSKATIQNINYICDGEFLRLDFDILIRRQGIPRKIKSIGMAEALQDIKIMSYNMERYSSEGILNCDFTINHLFKEIESSLCQILSAKDLGPGQEIREYFSYNIPIDIDQFLYKTEDPVLSKILMIKYRNKRDFSLRNAKINISVRNSIKEIKIYKGSTNLGETIDIDLECIIYNRFEIKKIMQLYPEGISDNLSFYKYQIDKPMFETLISKIVVYLDFEPREVVTIKIMLV